MNKNKQRKLEASRSPLPGTTAVSPSPSPSHETASVSPSRSPSHGTASDPPPTKKDDNQKEVLTEILDDIAHKFDDFDRKMDKLNNKLEGSEDKVQGLDKKIEEQVSKERKQTIEILGIFISIFTFISVEIQVFKFSSSILASAGLTLILLGSLIIFNIILNYFSYNEARFEKYKKREEILTAFGKQISETLTGSNEKDKLTINPKTWGNATYFSVISISLITIGIICIGLSPNEINNKYSNYSLIEKIEEKITTIKDDVHFIDKKVDILENNQKHIENDIEKNSSEIENLKELKKL